MRRAAQQGGKTMLRIPYPGSAAARRGATSIAVALMMSLAACGGGGGNGADTGSTQNNSGAAADGTSGTTPTTPTTPSTNASFFDSIFLSGTGTGYYQFEANISGSSVISAGRTAFYVNSDGDTNFSTLASAVSGNFAPAYTMQVYITSEGAFTSQSTFDTNIGTNSKIFSILAQGFELGMQGMSKPLYSVTINAQDVSGQPVSQVISRDETAWPSGLYWLYADNTPMPQGAQMYQVPRTIETTYLWLDLANGLSGTLESIQAWSGGEIQSLGGYRYLITSSDGRGGYVEYNGTVYNGVLFQIGDQYSEMGAAYNQIAADFLAQREAALVAK
jgi:hypothetical protein